MLTWEIIEAMDYTEYIITCFGHLYSSAFRVNATQSTI